MIPIAREPGACRAAPPRTARAAAAILVAAVGLACPERGGDAARTAEASPPGGSPSPKAQAAPRPGPGLAIEGTVRYQGPALAPDRPPAAFAPDCGKPPAPRTLALGGGAARDGVEGALIWVSEGVPEGDYPVPAQPATLDQSGCAYRPRVFGIRAGQPLAIVNSDPVLHNVHALGVGGGLLSRGANAFNVAMPVQGMRVVRRFEAAQVPVTLTCDVHPWMRAFAGVFTHPFFAVSGPSGAFRIEGLPPGRYTLSAWHERLGTRAQPASPGTPAELIFGR